MFDAKLIPSRQSLEKQDKVKGYSFVLLNRDGIQAKVSGGWARDPQDGDVPMKTNVPCLIGSVTKFVSGVALLHLFETKENSRGSVESQFVNGLSLQPLTARQY